VALLKLTVVQTPRQQLPLVRKRAFTARYDSKVPSVEVGQHLQPVAATTAIGIGLLWPPDPDQVAPHHDDAARELIEVRSGQETADRLCN